MGGKCKFFLGFTGVLLVLSLAVNCYVILKKDPGNSRKMESKKKKEKVPSQVEKIPELFSQETALQSGNASGYKPKLNAIPLLFKGIEARHNANGKKIILSFTDSAYISSCGPFRITPHVNNVSVTKSWNTIELEGEFQGGIQYRISGLKGTANTNGLSLAEDIAAQIQFPHRSPEVTFALRNGYFPLKGKNFSIPFSAVNSEKLLVKVERHYINNLHSSHSDYEMDFENSHLLTPVTEKSFTLPVFPKNQTFYHNLELKDLFPERLPGVYRITLYGNGPERTGSDTIYISITDLALQVIRDSRSKKTAVWVRTISGEKLPETGVELTLLSRKNQVIAKGRTDKNGKLILSDLPLALDKEDSLAGVTARNGKDFSYFRLLNGERDEGKTTPLPEKNSFHAFVFTERGVARPGEKISFFAFLRKEKEGLFLPRKGIPLLVQLQDPKNNRISSSSLESGSEGFLQGSFQIPESAPRGFWKIRVSLPGEKRDFATAYFQVASFVPDRLKITVKVPSGNLSTKSPIPFEATTNYYFGKPLAQGRTTLEVYCLNGKKPSFWDNSWTVGAPELFKTPSNYAIRNTSNEKGKTNFVYPGFQALNGKAFHPVALLSFLSSAEPGGRSVTANVRRTLHPSPFYIGVRKGTGPLSDRVTFEYTLLGAEDTPFIQLKAPLTIQFKLEKEEWNRILKKQGNRLQYQWVRKMIPCPENHLLLTIPAGKVEKGKIFRTPPLKLAPASYAATLSAGLSSGEELKTGFEFFHFTGETGNRMAHFYSLPITFDRESTLPGDEFRFSINSPGKGELFLTHGGRKMEGTASFPVRAGKNTFSCRVPGHISLSNYHIGCTLLVEGKNIPERLFGISRIKVDQKKHLLNLSFSHKKIAQPGEKLLLSLDCRDMTGKGRGGKAALFAVDSGILSLTNYKTPDIFKYFFGAYRSPMVFFDMYGDLLEDMRITPDGQVAGDGAVSQSIFHGKLVSLRQKKSCIMVLPAVTIPENGKATIPVTLPHHTGELTFFAVVSSGEKAGSTSSPITMREKAALLLSAPRAIAPGDEGILTATFFNNTQENLSASYSLTLPEGIKLLAGSPAVKGDLTLPRNGKHILSFPFRGVKSGEYTLALSLDSKGRKQEETFFITVRSVNPPETRTTLSILEKGESLTLAGNGDFEGTPKEVLRISGNPATTLLQGLDYLNSYPYGCLEQITAAAFPYLALPNLVALGFLDEAHAKTQAHKVLATQSRILSMALSDGSFSMWPNATESWQEGSVFALHFLACAEKGVKETLIPYRSRAFLRNLVSGNLKNESRALRAYAVMVLAILGDRNFLPAARNIIASTKKPDFALFLAGCALVKGGYASMGTPSIEDALAAECWKESKVPFEYADSICRKGLVLYILEDCALSSQEKYKKYAARLALDLAGSIRKDGSGWGSTHSNAWAVLGLSAYAARIGEKEATFQIQDSKQVTVRKTTGSFFHTGKENMVITNLGSAPLIVERIVTGIPRSYAKKNEGIRLRKEYFNLKGKAITEAAHGEKLFVRLTVSSKDPLKNVVITDLLPGGLAIEDEMLASRSAVIPSVMAKNYVGLFPKRLEKCDDRFLFFGDLAGKDKEGVITYQVRAVGKGKFRIPPLHAEAMYDNSAKGVYIPAGVFIVK